MTHEHSGIYTRQAALDKVHSLRSDAVANLSSTELSITDTFEKKVLATDIIAETAVPEHSYATMDGFAIDATEPSPYELVDRELFPEDGVPSLESGEAIRVATGAAIPEEANAVIKTEDATVKNGKIDGSNPDLGTYVYERGSNISAGETVFEAGERLSPKDAILLRDIGQETVDVKEPLDAGLIATGTEIHDGVTRDLDSPMLAALIRSWGHQATIDGTVPDEYDRVVDAIASSARKHDVVVTTGGTSVGKKDHVIRALNSLGDVVFHRVQIRPGKPLAAARLPKHDAIAFAVPGKPVGAHAITTLVVRPFFTGDDSLPTIGATATQTVDVPDRDFEYAIPVTLHSDNDGEMLAEPLGASDSPLAVYGETFDPSILSSSTRATRADGFVYTANGFTGAETVAVVPYPTVE